MGSECWEPNDSDFGPAYPDSRAASDLPSREVHDYSDEGSRAASSSPLSLPSYQVHSLWLLKVTAKGVNFDSSARSVKESLEFLRHDN